MQFGRVENLELIDFSLPQNPLRNVKILGEKPAKRCNVFIGCAKWGRPDWVGKLYPKGTKSTDFLKHYVKHFNSIEMNATHYRVFGASIIEKWKNTAPKGFVFCPKFTNSISHFSRLKNAKFYTSEFYQSIEKFEDRLGCMFLQMPPNFSPKDMDTLKNYLGHLPKHIPIAIELRHFAWFDSEQKFLHHLLDFMQQESIAFVITDTAGRREVLHQHLTNKTAFVRFVGNSLVTSDYQRIDDWVIRLGEWMNAGLENLYFFIHQHEELYSPELCDYMIKEMNDKLHLSIKRPRLINQNQTLF